MGKPLMDVVLPRLARPLYRQLEDFHSGKVSERQFVRRFERVLRRQHRWLAGRGVEAARAALAIHAGVLILSLPGLRAEAAEANMPLEVLEYKALCEAASDLTVSYGLPWRKTLNLLSRLVARHTR